MRGAVRVAINDNDPEWRRKLRQMETTRRLLIAVTVLSAALAVLLVSRLLL